MTSGLVQLMHGIFLGKYVLIISLYVHYTFCVSNVIILHVFPASYFAGLRSLAFEANFSYEPWTMQTVYTFRWLEKFCPEEICTLL